MTTNEETRTEEFAKQLHYFNDVMAEMRPVIGLDVEDLTAYTAAEQFLDAAIRDYQTAQTKVADIESKLTAARAELESTKIARQSAESMVKTVVRESIAALAARPEVNTEYLRNLQTALDLTEVSTEAETTVPTTDERKPSFLRQFFSLKTDTANQPHRALPHAAKAEDAGDLFGRLHYHTTN